MTRGSPGPRARAVRAREFCLVCGCRQVPTEPDDPICTEYHRPIGTCLWCGSLAADWAFLNIEPADPARHVVLLCPVWKCGAQISVALVDLAPGHPATAGNGPNTYAVLFRPSGKGYCPACGTYWSDVDILRARDNRARLLAAWADAAA